MGMNKVQKGSQMYPWCNATINFIKGHCEHMCQYCYIIAMHKRFGTKQKKPFLDEKELRTKLGKGNIVFVGSSTDMWAKEIKTLWIELILDHCREYDNIYIFQSKNPIRFMEFLNPNKFPKNTILGTTLESNRPYPGLTKASPPSMRMNDLALIHEFPKFVSIEPVLDFDLDIFVKYIKHIEPKFVSIGADSKGMGLKEPPKEKIEGLIKELEKFTEVRIKKNLSRLLGKKAGDDMLKK